MKKTGRPLGSTKFDQPLVTTFGFRVTPKEKELIKTAAKKLNLNISDYCRKVMGLQLKHG